MMIKNSARRRRARKTRAKIANSGAIRLSVHRSNNHIYAQVFSADKTSVLAQASSLEAVVKNKVKGNNKEAAAEVGKLIAQRAVKAGIKEVAFDRGGYKYHGRVKALAEAARETGLNLSLIHI